MSTGSQSPGPHQFYITHCARSDSVLNTVGFSVRAASTGSNDPMLVKLAMEYPAYELPMEMWAKKPDRSLAPRRLARVKTPQGVMVVHTSYLEKDTMNRDRSYFSHVLLLPSASPIDVLESWNADHWATDYRTGEPMELPQAAEPLPAGSALSREAVVEFLTSTDLGPAGSLAVGCWNDTLQRNHALRRDLVGRVMHGILRAEQDPVRNRLYIHAEPGVVAALIYAAAQLLPPYAVADLTFTTFEPAHRGLKEFKRALVVGTYLAQPNRGLDADLVQQRGYVVDCLHPDRGSSQLLGSLPAGIEKLLDLAAEGQWKVIETVHYFCGTRVKAAGDLERAMSLAAALDRLEQGVPTPNDLILLQQDEVGRNHLEPKKEILWPNILDLALNNDAHRESIRQVFRPWFTLLTRIDEIAESAFSALRNGDVATWKAHWQLLRSVLDQPESNAAMVRLLKARQSEVAQLQLVGRRAIRAMLKGNESLNPQALGSLFDPVCLEELDELLNDATLPARTVAAAAYAARCKAESGMRQRVSTFLANTSDDAFGEYAKLTLKNRERLEIARELFAIGEHGQAPYLDRLQKSASKYVAPADWLWFAKEHELHTSDKKIRSTMLQQQRLCKLLLAVCQEKEAQLLWNNVNNLFTIYFLLKETPARQVWNQLISFKDLVHKKGLKEEEAIDHRVAKRLQAAEVLQKVFEQGAETLSEDIKNKRNRITEAFKAFGCEQADGLDHFFKWLGGCDVDPSKNRPNLKRFASIFSVFFPPSEDNDAKNLVVFQKWIRLCKMNQEFQTELQVYFFDSETLSPQSSKQRRSLLKSCLSELNPDVLAKIKRREKQSTSEKRSKRKKAYSYWMSGIGGPLLVGLTIFLGAFGTFTVSRMMGSRDTTPVTDSTLSGRKEDQSTQQPKLQDSTKVTQSVTPAGPKDPSASKSTKSLPVVKPDVPVSPTNTEAPLVPVSPQGGIAKANNSSVDKFKVFDEKWKTGLKKTVDLCNELKEKTKDVLDDLTKLKDNYSFLEMSPTDYTWTKNMQDSKNFFMPDRLQKANKLCGELKTQEAKNALREAVNKSLIDFLPDKLALDASLKIKFMPNTIPTTVLRSTVTWKKLGDSINNVLTKDPEKPNECSGDDAIQWIHKQRVVTVEPLRASQDAYNYTQARNNLKIINHDGVSALRKLVLEDIRPNKITEWNHLPKFDASPGAPASNLYNRVKIVVDALNNPALPNLFPKGEKTPMATAP